MPEAVVAGHVTLDITPYFRPEYVPLEEIFVPGRLIDMHEAGVATGGVVSNTGLSMLMLGVDACLMGKIGRDLFGQGVRDFFGRYGASGGLVEVDGATSYTIVVAPPKTDRIFLHHPGCNNTFRTADVRWDTVAASRLFHFGYPPLMRSMYEQDGAELELMMRTARHTGATVSLDMALPDPTSDAGRADWRRIVARSLPYVDVFLPSLEELQYMTDPARYAALLAQPGGVMAMSEREALALADETLRLGVAIAVVKMGTRGVLVRTAGAERLSRAGRAAPRDISAWAGRTFRAPCFVAERVASTSGAGDACIAGFLTGLLRGLSLEQTAALACASGALNVAVPASVGGIDSLEDTLRRIPGWATMPMEG